MNKDTETILSVICPNYEDGKCECNVHQSREKECTGNCHYGMIAEELIENGVFVRPSGEWYVEKLPVPDDAKNKNMERYRRRYLASDESTECGDRTDTYILKEHLKQIGFDYDAECEAVRKDMEQE